MAKIEVDVYNTMRILMRRREMKVNLPISNNIGGGGGDSFQTPTTQVSNIFFYNIASTTFSIQWTVGNGDYSLVIIKALSSVNEDPVNGTTYTANSAFGSGDELGTGNYVVYSGSGNSVNVTGLTSNTLYYVRVFSFNGSDGQEGYNTDTETDNPTQVETLRTLQLPTIFNNSGIVFAFDPAETGAQMQENGFTGNPITAVALTNSVGTVHDLSAGVTLISNSDSNRPTLVSDTGRIGWNFSGSNQQFYLRNSTFYLQPLHAVSPVWELLFWIKMGTTSDGVAYTIWDSNQGTGARDGIRIGRTTGNKIQVLLTTTVPATDPINATSAASLTEASGWTRIRLSCNGSGANKFTIKVGSAAAETFTVNAGGTVVGLNDLYLGTTSGTLTGDFKGQIGQIVLLNRVSTSQELTDFDAFNPSLVTDAMPPVLRANYDFHSSSKYQDIAKTTPATSNNDPVAIISPTNVTTFGNHIRDLLVYSHSILLTGTSGTATITVNGVGYTATFATSLVQTARNFVSTHSTALFNAGVTVEGPNADASADIPYIRFRPNNSPRTDYTPSIANATGNLNGSVTSGAERPLLKTNALNGYAAIEYDGVDDNLNAENPSLMRANLIWVVVFTNTQDEFGSHIAVSSSGSTRFLITAQDYVGNEAVTGDPDVNYFTTHNVDPTKALGRDLVPNIFIHQFNGTTIKYLAGAENSIDSVTNSTAFSITKYGDEEIVKAVHNWQVKGQMHLIRLYNGVMTDNQLKQLFNELKNKYAIS